jgi:kumamolisin
LAFSTPAVLSLWTAEEHFAEKFLAVSENPKESKSDMNRRFATFTLFAALVLACSCLIGLASAQDAVHFYAQPPIRVLSGPDQNPAGPPPGAETPGSIACLYQLVKQTKGCPIATSKALPSTKGWGAIALVDAFDNPQAVNDIKVFAQQFGIKKYSFKQVYATGHKPQFDQNWALEEALDIEMAVAMAPKAKIYLVEAATNSGNDLYFAETVAADLVAKAGGGVVSNSWQGSEYNGELQDEKTYFSHPGVVYFASSGDIGFRTGVPAVFASVVGAGGTQILRNNGNFLAENYWSSGGSGLSQFEPRPAYQNIIKKIVGSQRGVPDFSAVATNVGMYDASNGGWFSVAGTSISSPLLAGIVNAAGSKAKSTKAELTEIYKDYANKKTYKADFRDIINPKPNCKTGWDLCDGVGSPITYKGK